MNGPAWLADERSSPTFREVVGQLLRHARLADFAVARIRLQAVDLEAAELAGLDRCRVLLGRLDVHTLTAAPSTGVESPGPSRLRHLRVLAGFAASGRLQVRVSAGQMWVPDFSVFHGLSCPAAVPSGAVCLLGAHTFAHFHPVVGPSLTSVMGAAQAVRRAGRQFAELWELGYDVLPVVAETLEAVLAGEAADENAPPGTL